MDNTLINMLVGATSKEELLSYKDDIIKAYSSAMEDLYTPDTFLCKTNYEDIENLCNLEQPMAAYYGPEFYSKCGFPFIKKHNPSTLKVIKMTFWFYSVQIIELLENGFWDNVSLQIFRDSEMSEEPPISFDRTEYVNFTEICKDKPFEWLWMYFKQLITIDKDTREINISWSYSDDLVFYIDDNAYNIAINKTYSSYIDSKYSDIVDRILGVYKLRFTPAKFILDYQPLFVRVSWHYLLDSLQGYDFVEY